MADAAALLSNVLYAGLIRHKDELVAGQQPALVEVGVFQAVNAILKSHERGPLGKPKQKQEGLLGTCFTAMVADLE